MFKSGYDVNVNANGEITWKDDANRPHHAWFANTTDAWAIANGLQHEIYFSGADRIRFANVKQTVVYVATDEDGEGKPVIIKWNCKAKFYN